MCGAGDPPALCLAAIDVRYAAARSRQVSYPLTDVLFFALILEYDRGERAAEFRNTGIREVEEVIMRKPMTSRGEASSSPAIPICPMTWRERAAKRMQEGIPVSPGLLNQVLQIAQVCAAPSLPD